MKKGRDQPLPARLRRGGKGRNRRLLFEACGIVSLFGIEGCWRKRFSVDKRSKPFVEIRHILYEVKGFIQLQREE
jgi:hypothetical protein